MRKIDMYKWVCSCKQVEEGRLPNENVLKKENGGISFGFGELYFVEYFCSHFLISKSKERQAELKAKVMRWSNPVAKAWALYAFDRASLVIKDSNETFEEALEDITFRLGLPYSHITSIFRPYLPFLTTYEAFKFAYDNLNSPHFAYFYLLLIYFYEDEYPTQTTELQVFQKEITESFISLAPKDIRSQALSKLYQSFALINRTGLFERKLGLSYDKVLYGEGKPLTGKFYLRWDKVDFFDGFYMVRHPDVPFNKYRPYRVEDTHSRRAFKDISALFMKSIPPLRVEAKDGQIISILNKTDLSSCITILEHKVSAPTPIKKAKKLVAPSMKVERRELSSHEATSLCRELKSRYLNYLCAKQLDKYNVVCCIEHRINSAGNMSSEYSFIFTIKETTSKLYLAYENSTESRCTYLFPVTKTLWQRGIDRLYNFFASNEINKRQSLASRLVDLQMPGGYDYQRIFHNDYLGWVDKIKYCI